MGRPQAALPLSVRRVALLSPLALRNQVVGYADVQLRDPRCLQLLACAAVLCGKPRPSDQCVGLRVLARCARGSVLGGGPKDRLTVELARHWTRRRF